MSDVSPATAPGQPGVTDDSADDSERALVAAVVRKDRKATAEFVARFADPVHAYVRLRLLPRTDLTDDLVQEVFLAALKGLPSFGGRSSLKVWLLGIARHKVEIATGPASDERKPYLTSMTTRGSGQSSCPDSTR